MYFTNADYNRFRIFGAKSYLEILYLI